VNYKSSFSLILFIIIFVNALGYFLRYFGYNTYFILIGFRFHIAFFLPFILILRKEGRIIFRQTFLEPRYKGKFLPLIWILIPLLVISVSPFLTEIIKQGDPEHFYEFGLSSLFDYPIYLIWNFPQLALFYLFLASAASGRKNKFSFIFPISFFLFVFEFLPVKFNAELELNYSGLGALFLTAFICAILIKFFENIYWFSISVFTILWIYFLAFGTKSALIVNILFASRYKSWEGFLIGDKGITSYLLLFYLMMIIIILFIALPLRRSSKSKLHFSEAKNISQIPGIG
jgi:hypothetical protein